MAKTSGKVTSFDGSFGNGNVTYLHLEPLPWPSARILDPPDQKLATLPAPKHLSSASSGTNSTGAVAWNEQYTPFGETILNPAANDNLDGFTGHIKDKATGLNYMQARYYDPALGRFLSIDPVGFMPSRPGQFNHYSYTYNDPVNAIDPDGEIPLISGAIGAGIGGVVGGVSSFVTSGGDFKAAAIGAAGGAVAGGIIGSTGQVTAGLAAGSATSSVLTQATANGGFDLGNVSLAETAVDTAVGVSIGKVVGNVKVSGITTGRNSYSAVAKSNATKLRNGTISAISPKSAGKAVVAGVVGGAGQELASTGAGRVKGVIKDGAAALGSVAASIAESINNVKDNLPTPPPSCGPTDC